MKVFVYEKKKPCKKVAIINNVHTVIEKGNTISIYTTMSCKEFDVKKFKTSIFQN